MKIKTKLTSGIGLLFMIIVLLGVLAISYIDKLADDTKISYPITTIHLITQKVCFMPSIILKRTGKR